LVASFPVVALAGFGRGIGWGEYRQALHSNLEETEKEARSGNISCICSCSEQETFHASLTGDGNDEAEM